jgi:hypothetical protein
VRGEVLGDAVVDSAADAGFVEQRSPHADRGRAGDDELERVARVTDAALADDRHAVRARNLGDLHYLEQRDRFDRRARQAALHVADYGPARVHVDRHPHHRIDHGEPVAAGLDAAPCVLADVRLVRRQLGDQRFAGHRAAGLDDARRHVRVVAELDAAFLDVRAGDVQLDRVDRRILETTRDFDVVVDRRTADVREESGFGEVERRQDRVDDVIDARVLQADRVQHALRRLVDAVRRVAETRFARRAFQDDRASVAVRKPFNPGVFLSESDAPGQQHDRRSETQAAEVDGE